MKLNATNRRRDLKRRRKLMPEPRRHVPESSVQEPEVLREVPAGIIQNRFRIDLEQRVEQGESDPSTAQSWLN